MTALARLNLLYLAAKKVLFESTVIGTNDASVKVLDRKTPFDRTGRIWPYYGDADHSVILFDYTPTRERSGAGRARRSSWPGYRGYLQADADGGYDAFFKNPVRGLIEVSCWLTRDEKWKTFWLRGLDLIRWFRFKDSCACVKVFNLPQSEE
jgi:hypothetical protein